MDVTGEFRMAKNPQNDINRGKSGPDWLGQDPAGAKLADLS